MRFPEISYTRPDAEAVKSKITALTARLRAASVFADAEGAFLEYQRLLSSFETAETLASIRHDIDTRDGFYEGEVQFFDAVSPEIEEFSQGWTLAMLESAFRPEFEAKYGRLMFTNAEINLKTFSPDIIPELQKENALVTEYSALIASAQIPFEGGVYTLSQLTPFKLDPDDARRMAAWKAEDAWLFANGERLDEIYAELTALRDGMGKKLGYGGFTKLGYYRMNRNCYDKSDVEKFREAVRVHIVPVAERVIRRQAERLGKEYPMSMADCSLEFRSGNPTPRGTPDDILAQGRKFYHELSPESAVFIDAMLDGEYMDVLSRTGKAGGGYCTSLHDYRTPFIFANFNGTSHDVEVITHEAGHAFANWLARDLIPLEYRWPTLEACEVHSMSMEFFAWPWAGGFFGEDSRKFQYSHLSGALTFIPYGTLVDHFQHIVYEQPDMTPEQRHAQWRRLSAIYTPWIRLDPDELPFYGSGRRWQHQSHIYMDPFYYIDYCLAQTMSLQFWARIMEDRHAAWETYMAYTRPAGTKTFLELIDGAGLESPFGDGALRGVAAAAEKWLDGLDMTGID